MTAKKAAKLSPTAAGIDPLAPQATNHPAKLTPEEAVTFDFAVNIVKLNRAKAWVNQNAEQLGSPKGKAFVEAVKERYIALGGLLANEAQIGRVPHPKHKKNVVNLADSVADDD